MNTSASYIAVKSNLRKAKQLTLLTGAVLMISACVSTTAPPVTDSVSSTKNSGLITTPGTLTSSPNSLEEVALDDIVRAMVQYRDPITTTLQASLDLTNNDDAGLLAVLAERGYGLQLVDADQGANLLEHVIENLGSNNSPSTRHTLKVGRLEIAREYTTVNGKTRPVSPLMVSGSRRRINLDDSRFGQTVANDQLVSRIAFSVSDAVAPEDTRRISLLQVPMTPAEMEVGVGTNASGLEVGNIFYGQDNFGSILNDYDVVETITVIFPNDSMRIGNIGRLKIDVFLTDFLETTDLVRVIGCSNGTTKIDIGNQGLALGRAERVTQELLARGVTREHILDEGCWSADTAGERFPSRGVVLELYRAS